MKVMRSWKNLFSLKFICIAVLTLAFLSPVTAQSVPAGLEFEINGNSVTITGYTGAARTLVIPDRIQGLPVTEIQYGAFALTKLTHVTMPPSITCIGEGAFFGTPLTSVTIPASVIYIGHEAFQDTPSLISIIVDNHNSAYADIGGVLFDKGIQTLIQYPARRNDSIYVIPPSVIHIGDLAFSEVTLRSVMIPPSVTHIGECAFDSSGLISVTIPPSVTFIGRRAFADSNLNSVTIPSSVAYIGDGAFYDTPLTSVTLSRQTTVEEDAFPPNVRITYSD